jgi:pimeloyl-ACP methyl ester carboxylesterase
MHLLDHPLISERYLFPRHEPFEDARMIPVGDGVSLACFHAAWHPDGLTLVHFHGNGEVVADYLPDYPTELDALGVNTFLAEYRGYGGSTGVPSLTTLLGDSERVFAALGLPEERVVVYGRSLGSFAAIELASRHPGLAGVILESGIADPLERLLIRVTPEELGCTEAALTAAAAERLDHRRKLGAYKGRLLVMHAAGDSMVDSSHAQRNHEWGGGTDKRLLLFPRGDHNSVLFENHAAYWAAMSDFLVR